MKNTHIDIVLKEKKVEQNVKKPVKEIGKGEAEEKIEGEENRSKNDVEKKTSKIKGNVNEKKVVEVNENSEGASKTDVVKESINDKDVSEEVQK